jgi:hypothetical protein
MSSLGLFRMLNSDRSLACAHLGATSEIYFITTTLFAMTFVSKMGLLLSTKTASVSSILTLLVFMYGGITHLLLYMNMDMFVFQSQATGRCIAVAEFLQWCCTCQLLYLSLFTSARKMTVKAKTIVLCEHLSIVASAISVFVPSARLHTLAILTATCISVTAKIGMLNMFRPAKNTLDIRLLPYIYLIMALYFAFPIIYILGVLEWITESTELTVINLSLE